MKTRRFSARSGFSLIELLAVITIIGILAGLIIGASKYAYQKSKKSSVAGRIATLEAKLEDFKADNGYYPQQTVSPPLPGCTTVLFNALNGVTTSKKYFTAFTAVETNKTEIIDSFGNEYQYVCPGIHNAATYDLWSNGPDGISGTADDISNWQSSN